MFLVDIGLKWIFVDVGVGMLYGDCCGKLFDDLCVVGYVFV